MAVVVDAPLWAWGFALFVWTVFCFVMGILFHIGYTKSWRILKDYWHHLMKVRIHAPK